MTFIYVGRLDELKGIKVLFEAWKEMGKEAPELRVCGTGPLIEWCHEFISLNNLSSVEMMGNIDNEQAKKLMADSIALILPTQWYEGFPMVIVEAYSVGTPVIGPDMGKVGCLIKDDLTGWKYQTDTGNDVGCLVEAILSAEQSQIRREYVIAFGKLYTAEANYITLSSVYEEIVSRR